MQALKRWLGIIVLFLGILVLVFGIQFIVQAGALNSQAEDIIAELEAEALPPAKSGLEMAKGIGLFGAQMALDAADAMIDETAEKWKAEKERQAGKEADLAEVEGALKGISAVDPGVAAYLGGDQGATPDTIEGAYLMASRENLLGVVATGKLAVAAAEGAIMGGMGFKMGAMGTMGTAEALVGLSEGSLSSVEGFIASAEGMKGTAIFVNFVGIVNVLIGVGLIVAGAVMFLMSRAVAAIKPSSA